MEKKRKTENKASKVKIIEADEELRERMNDKFSSLFTVQDTLPPALPTWDGGGIPEATEVIRRYIDYLMKDLDPCKARDPDGSSANVHKVNVVTTRQAVRNV